MFSNEGGVKSERLKSNPGNFISFIYSIDVFFKNLDLQASTLVPSPSAPLHKYVVSALSERHVREGIRPEGLALNS